MDRRALFLDRDGVINVDHGYVHLKEKFEFIDGIFECVAEANRVGYLVIVVTNQAGIGRGYYTEDDFSTLMDWVRSEFILRGGRIDGVYYCPDHPVHGIGKYRRESEFRKPGPGMFLQAAAEWGIDLGHSIMVGDKLSDIEAARAAGVGTLLLLSEQVGDNRGFLTINGLTDVLPFIASCSDSSPPRPRIVR